MTSKKRRKYGDLSANPLPTNDGLIDDVFAAFTGPRPSPSPEPTSTPEATSRPEAVSRQEVDSSPANAAGPELETPLASQTSSLEVASSPEAISPPAANLAAYSESLTYGKGHLRINNDYFDRVLTLLSDLEQLFFFHVLRYREGRSDHTVLLNFPLLESRTHVSTRTLSKVAASLERKGLLVRFGHRFGKGGAQGFRFRIVMPSSLVAASGPEAVSSLEAVSDNKRLKDQDKRKGKTDASHCPDCFGTGMWYPEGFDKGVAKCRHEKLSKSGEAG